MADEPEQGGWGADKRQELRSLLEFPVRVQFSTSSDAVDSITGDLSPGGMFVADEDPKPIGTMVRFELGADGERPVQGLGVVAWIRVRWEGQGRPAGMGIEFRSLGEGGAELIERLVAEATRRAPAAARVAGAKPLPLIPPPPSPDGIEPLRPDPPPPPRKPAEKRKPGGKKGGAEAAKGGEAQKMFADIRTKKGGKKKAGKGAAGSEGEGNPKRTYALLAVLALLLLIWMC